MKPNFECPKCHNMIKVGKQLHASYTCNRCNHKMVLSKADVMNRTCEYRDPYAYPTPLYNKWKREHKNKYNNKTRQGISQ